MKKIAKTKPPCGHAQPQPDSCRWCGMAVNRDRRYLALWWPDESVTPKVSSQHGPAEGGRAVCVHLGEPTGGRVACPSCRGRVQLKLFACAVHGSCTPLKKAPGVACCVGCSDYQS